MNTVCDRDDTCKHTHPSDHRIHVRYTSDSTRRLTVLLAPFVRKLTVLSSTQRRGEARDLHRPRGCAVSQEATRLAQLLESTHGLRQAARTTGTSTSRYQSCAARRILCSFTMPI
eukprot:3716626-Pyramimonas_sp.AAC.1